MTNREALQASLASLGGIAGYEAEIQAAYALADEIDQGNTSAEIFREYRMAVKAIREALSDDGGVDENVTSLLERLGGTPIRNRANG